MSSLENWFSHSEFLPLYIGESEPCAGPKLSSGRRCGCFTQSVGEASNRSLLAGEGNSGRWSDNLRGGKVFVAPESAL